MTEYGKERLIPIESRKIHGLAEQAREEGRFVDALKYTDEAMLGYQSQGDMLGFSEVLSSRFLTLRHLFEQTGDRLFLISAKHTVQASVEIARESGNSRALAIPLFNLAKAQETMEETSEAASTYREAVLNITNNPSEFHDSPAVLADFKLHLATCEYKAGDSSALARATEAMKELEGADHSDEYSKDVWVSGGYMRIADMLRFNYPNNARAYLDKAKSVIDSNPKLELRAKQWEKLAASFNP